jgi:carbamoyl-phosphate synthase large subunit
MMNKSINILFLGGAKRVSIAELFIKAGRKKNLNVNIFSYELTEKVPINIVAKVLVGLKWNDRNLYTHLHKLIKENQINIVLPFVDPAIEVAAKLKTEINSIFVPVSKIELCRILFDKNSSAKWFDSNSISIPKTYTIDSVRFPAIYKPATGSASKGIIIAKEPKDAIQITEINDYLIQDYIWPNQEITVDCYVSGKNQIISIVPRIRLETAGGEVVRSITVKDATIIELSERILKSDDFIGPITIQFLKDINNNCYAMEINPRLGGGVICSIWAGADIPGNILDEFLGLDIFPCYNWKENTLMTRYFKEVIFYADNN